MYDLNEKAGILHRDISVNNIMYEIKDNQVYFILIDFDMAKLLPDGEADRGTPSAKHRTGTLPFMAYELLRDASMTTCEYEDGETDSDPIRHLVRHDFSSLFLVSLWCVEALLLAGLPWTWREALVTAAKSLESGTIGDIASRRKCLCTEPLRAWNIRLPPAARCLGLWFNSWQGILMESFLVQDKFDFRRERAITEGRGPPDFDDETCDGMFTKDKLKAALDADTPDVPCINFTALDPLRSSPDSELAIQQAGTYHADEEVMSPARKTRSKEDAAEIRAQALTRLRPRKAAVKYIVSRV